MVIRTVRRGLRGNVGTAITGRLVGKEKVTCNEIVLAVKQLPQESYPFAGGPLSASSPASGPPIWQQRTS